MLAAALSFLLLTLLPIDFAYPVFAAILLFNGISMGMFASPNRAAVMNSLPPGDRGAGGGMNQTFQNSAQVMSIGIFFTLMIAGLASSLPGALSGGLEAHGVAPAAAHHAGQTPPISVLFAAFLGYNPVQHLVGAEALAGVSPHAHAVLAGRAFFPHLIAQPFADGLDTAFGFAIVACLVAAAASLLRGGRYAHDEQPAAQTAGGGAGAGVGGVLERVVERLELGPGAVAALQRERDQVVGQPGVLRQQRAVQVGADQVVAAHALEAVAAVVAVALQHPAERLGAGAEVGAAAVVLEAGEDPRAAAEVDLDRDVADQPRARLAHGLQLGEPEARQLLLAELVAVAEQLVAAADGEQGGAVVDRRRERLALAGDQVGGDHALVAVLAAADVDEVVGGGVDRLADPAPAWLKPIPRHSQRRCRKRMLPRSA